MRDFLKISIFFILIFTFSVTSCKKEEEEEIIDYYSMAKGIWNISPDCEEYEIPFVGTVISLNEQMPEEVEIFGNNGNILYITLDENNIEGNINNNGLISVSKQTVTIDMGFGPMDIDIQGTGIVNSSSSAEMNLTYSFEIEAIPGFPIAESLDCILTLTK